MKSLHRIASSAFIVLLTSSQPETISDTCLPSASAHIITVDYCSIESPSSTDAKRIKDRRWSATASAPVLQAQAQQAQRVSAHTKSVDLTTEITFQVWSASSQNVAQLCKAPTAMPSRVSSLMTSCWYSPGCHLVLSMVCARKRIAKISE